MDRREFFKKIIGGGGAAMLLPSIPPISVPTIPAPTPSPILAWAEEAWMRYFKRFSEEDVVRLNGRLTIGMYDYDWCEGPGYAGTRPDWLIVDELPRPEPNDVWFANVERKYNIEHQRTNLALWSDKPTYGDQAIIQMPIPPHSTLLGSMTFDNATWHHSLDIPYFPPPKSDVSAFAIDAATRRLWYSRPPTKYDYIRPQPQWPKPPEKHRLANIPQAKRQP